jgi:ketose-bisphosphate aldolase
MIVRTAELYRKALAAKYAIGAFNVSTLEAIKAIINAANRLNSPVVIETSESEMAYLEPGLVVDIVKELGEKLSIPIGIHLDHGKSFEIVQKAIEAGYTSVHFDGSLLPFEENVCLTKEVVDYARSHNISVEAELGKIPGSSKMHTEEIEITSASMTDPIKAKEFVDQTGIDILAVSIGNTHGLFANEPKLDFILLGELKGIGIPMALHGGSGIPEDQIRKAIELGIAKVNVNTELRVAYTDTLRQELSENPEEIVPYEYLPEEIEAIEDIVDKKIKLFGSSKTAT